MHPVCPGKWGGGKWYELGNRFQDKSRPPKPTIRRTLSLDTIVGPYLQGRWPKEAESQGVTCVNDKATQVNSPDSIHGLWYIRLHSSPFVWNRSNQTIHTPVLHFHVSLVTPPPPPPPQTVPLTPLSRLAPRLRRSVEGLNLELEGVFVSETPEDQHKILDVPDGHRAPVPPSPASFDSALLSPSESPCALNPALLSPSQSPCPMGEPDPVDCETVCPSPVVLDPSLLQPSSSPRPNKTYSFQREPPEGCERVRVVCEETIEPLLQVSCPDPNKVNFTPHGGSAFCPVSLLKPLLPSMDLLFRGTPNSPHSQSPNITFLPVPKSKRQSTEAKRTLLKF
uniref:Family with sequence similarity 117 member Aa n=1 Tax=Salmo trutta TaxID=8032 RepID=A0A673VMF3_SALTR